MRGGKQRPHRPGRVWADNDHHRIAGVAVGGPGSSLGHSDAASAISDRRTISEISPLQGESACCIDRAPWRSRGDHDACARMTGPAPDGRRPMRLKGRAEPIAPNPTPSTAASLDLRGQYVQRFAGLDERSFWRSRRRSSDPAARARSKIAHGLLSRSRSPCNGLFSTSARKRISPARPHSATSRALPNPGRSGVARVR